MRVLVKTLVEPLNIKNFLILNVLVLVAIKLAVPFYGPQLATIIEQSLPFDSRQVISDTNKVRADAGLAPVSANSALDLAASEKLNDMLANSYFAHVSPQGITPWSWFTKAGYKYSYAGENLALGFSDPNSTVQAWMNSPSHRENLLNKNYTEIGVASAPANIDGINGILVVQMFGRPSVLAVAIKPQPSPNVSPKPKPSLQPSPVTSNLVSGSETAVIQPAVNQISTDIAVPSVNAPTSVARNNLSQSISIAGKLNLIYEVYLLVATVLLGLAIGFLGTRKKLVLATAMNFALFLIAISIPAIQIAGKSLVF